VHADVGDIPTSGFWASLNPERASARLHNGHPAAAVLLMNVLWYGCHFYPAGWRLLKKNNDGRGVRVEIRVIDGETGET